MWTQCTSVTDRQTNGQTDRRTDRITITKTVQRIASHGKNHEGSQSYGGDYRYQQSMMKKMYAYCVI